MSFPDWFSNINKDLHWIKDRTIFLTIHGSVAYGLNTPESDIDYRGICIPTKEYFLGFNKNFEQLVLIDPDATIFNIIKFFGLTAANNPNTLELLFVDEKDHLLVTEAGQLLIDNRDKFLSKQLKERYIGYAKAQAHRIKNHKKWLHQKMTAPPTRKECGLPDKPLIDKDQFDAIKSLINKKLSQWTCNFEPFSDSQKIYLQGKVSDILTEMEITSDDQWNAAARCIGLDDNLIEIISKEKFYESKIEDWKNYLSWKKNRNPKRAALEEKFGFDLKHGTQLVRLLKLGKEALENGVLQVKRTYDREELMGIKNGSMTFEQLIEYADKIEEEIKESYKTSKLPDQPDIKFLDNLCVSIIEKSFL